MRLEHIPLILGAIVALIGLGFIADASMSAASPVKEERRRRARAEPSRTGEALVGIGTLCLAAALFGRDTWRYGTVAVLAGSILLLLGVILNRAFLKEALFFRGPARRAEEGIAVEPRPRVSRSPASAAATPTPVAGSARFDAPAPPARPAPRPASPATPASESRPLTPAEDPPGPQERRKTPRGKR